MKTKSLAFIAGLIWLVAGFNVCRIGVESWMSHGATSVIMVVGCSDSRRGERCATVGGGVIRAAMGGDVWCTHRAVVFNGLVGFTCAKV